MVLRFLITAAAIAGLFIIKRHPTAAYYIWTGTNYFWLLETLKNAQYEQAAMFAAFTISCVIQYFRSEN